MTSPFGFGIIDTDRLMETISGARAKAQSEIIPSAVSLALVPFIKELVKGFTTRWR